MPEIKLLDCTLRDGGYVNSWRWGFSAARDIIATLTRAGVDIVEVGFLRNVEGYNPDVTVCNTIEELNRLLPPEGQRGHTIYSGMAMRSNYDISKLSPYDGHGIEVIRITAHDYDIRDGMDFAREVKARGYKLSINPINIMGYADKDLLWIFDQVNAIHPWQFSIVDTFGSMRRRDLERIVSLADHNLAPDIRLGLHLHENMALSFCLAQEFMDKPLLRDKTVDASLMGMGRTPGNLPIELVADYRTRPATATTTWTRSWMPSRTTSPPSKAKARGAIHPGLLPVGPVQPAPQLRRALSGQGRSDQPGHQPHSGCHRPGQKNRFRRCLRRQTVH